MNNELINMLKPLFSAIIAANDGYTNVNTLSLSNSLYYISTKI